MINQNELRIGNLCWDKKSKELLSVSGLSDDGPAIFTVVNRTNYPLPNGWQADYILLTPKWLGKFVFQASNGIEMHNDLWLIVHTHEDRANLYDIKKNTTVQLNIPCRYVHQLQNLYFALYGEELTIKETV